MKQYKFVNNLTGWITFLIAATVYCLTIEPTASFWDCPEFITTGYKLEVGHPPGAPFFMLVANFFSLFASGPSEVARMVNYMSALMSGACDASRPIISSISSRTSSGRALGRSILLMTGNTSRSWSSAR